MRIAPVCTLRIAVTVVQVLCVLTAWKRHMILWENAAKFKQVANELIAADYMPRLHAEIAGRDCRLILHADCLPHWHCMQVGDRLQILLYALAIISTTVAILYTAEGCELALGAALAPESRGESEGESRGESRDEMMNGTWSGEGEDAADRDAVAGEGGAVAGGDGLGAVVSTIAAERGAVAGMTWWGLFVILLPMLSTAVG
jgi:hypothetical protein